MSAKHQVLSSIQRIPAYLLIALVRFYQWVISPMKNALLGPGGCCRYSPSCSHYAIESLRVHGYWRGSYFSARRILRCHPFSAGGWDPVKPAKKSSSPKHSRPESIVDLLP